MRGSNEWLTLSITHFFCIISAESHRDEREIMKKSTKKKIKYFLGTFFVTLLVGALVLVGAMKWKAASQTEESEIIAAAYTEEEVPLTPGEIAEDTVKGAVAEEMFEEAAQEEDEPGEEVVAEEIPEISGEVILTFGGDICFHDPFANMASLAQRGGSIESCISADLLSEMRQSDVCMVNNEFPYSGRGTPIPEKAFTFCSKPENVNLLHEMGVDVVSLANNHAYDHGEVALLDTLDILGGANIKYVGAGRNLEEASEPVCMEINGVKIAILAATQIERLDTPDTKGATENAAGVLRCFSEGELMHFLNLIEETKKACDVLIVYIHWGTENTDALDWAQPHQADLISKAGADIIVGAHPHCLQGLDSVNGVPVVYSLGNYWFNSKALDTALLKVTVEKEGVKAVQIIPARQENCSTSMLYDGEKQRVLDYLRSLSPNITLDADGVMNW